MGVLLEVARNLQLSPIDLGVDIILFDAEDYGNPDMENTFVLGSTYWANNLHKPGYKAQYGILLDMVGAKDARFPKEQVSASYAGPVLNKIWDLANRMGYGNYFSNVSVGGITDDHLPVNTIARIPMIDIINLPASAESDERRFGDHWHTHNDDMDVINKRTINAVGRVVVAVIYREANGDM